MITTLPQQVLKIFSIFDNQSIDLFLVGGSVRDMILNQSVADYDFACATNYTEIMSIVHQHTNAHCFLLSVKFGTVVVILDKLKMEITPFRTESDYLDYRHPSKVTFIRSLEQDLARRDFKINAIAYHPVKGIIDPNNGIADIKNKVITCVNDPNIRFNEDALRMLRAIRFSLKLGFKLQSDVELAITKNACLLKKISCERIQKELNACLETDRKDIVLLLIKTNVLQTVFPCFKAMIDYNQLSRWHNYDLIMHTNIALNNSYGLPLCAKLALLFHDVGKINTQKIDDKGNAHYLNHAAESAKIAKAILHKYHYPTALSKQVAKLIQYHDTYIKLDSYSIQKFVSLFDHKVDLAILELKIQYADNLAKNLNMITESNKIILQAIAKIEEIDTSNSWFKKKDLAISGLDLQSLGIEKDEISTILNKLYDIVLKDIQLNNSQYLIDYTIKLKQQMEK